MELDSSLQLEDSYYQSGFEEGVRDGQVHGLIEGRIYGSEVSYERFMSLGLLYGRMSVWRVQHASNPRVVKHLERVEDLLKRVPMDNSETKEGEDFESLMASIQGKMKVVASLSGEENLIRQGIIPEAVNSKGNADLEDGAEFAVKLRGGKSQGCGDA